MRITPAERSAIAARMMVDIETLASDEYEGRAPGTPGGLKTVGYLTQRFAEVGLTSGTNDPGNPWRAPVALTSFRATSSKIEVTVGGKVTTFGELEAVAVTTRKRELIADSDVVFVGYGASDVASEDVMGKVVVMLADASLNPERRILLEDKQASAVIVVPDVPGAIDGFFVTQVRMQSDRESVSLTGEIDEAFGVVVEQKAMARALGEKRWSALVAAAKEQDFKPLNLDAKVNIEANSDRRDFDSYNVLGRIAGTKPDNEAVLVMAHWDHLGLCRPEGEVDRICNGALDNASGIALMLELARRLEEAGPYERDIYVLATTAEESGLLGAQAFVANPPLPLTNIVAAFNFDTVALAPAGAPVGFVGEGRTPLDRVVLEELLASGRDLGDRDYAERYVQRQDAWALLQKGVPAVLLSSAFASEITAGPFFEGVYHSPKDEVGAIEFGGAVDDLLLHEALVKRLARPVVKAQ
ncbi:MAG: M28 family peptidase [Pseudomonadota bacterium]